MSFLKITKPDQNATQDSKHIGSAFKKKKTTNERVFDKKAIERMSRNNGFNRTIEDTSSARLGRPPRNEDMTYWRIYISPILRDELTELRDKEGRRLNDLLEAMLAAYKK